jgi:hypothetical protein
MVSVIIFFSSSSSSSFFFLFFFFFFFFFFRRYNFRDVLAFRNEFLLFGPVSDAVLPVCYFLPCYIALYIIVPSIFRSS